MKKLSYKNFAQILFLTAQDLKQDLNEKATDFKDVLKNWQADNAEDSKNKGYTKQLGSIKIQLWKTQKNILHFNKSPFYLNHSYYLVPQSSISRFWQEFDDALTVVAQSFKENCNEITLLKEGIYKTHDDDIKYLKFIYFKYGSLIIGFQHTYKNDVDVPFLEGFIALDLNDSEIPFKILDL